MGGEKVGKRLKFSIKADQFADRDGQCSCPTFHYHRRTTINHHTSHFSIKRKIPLSFRRFISYNSSIYQLRASYLLSQTNKLVDTCIIHFAHAVHIGFFVTYCCSNASFSFVNFCSFYRKKGKCQYSMSYSVQISACWIIFHDHLLRNFSNHQKLFSEIQSTISDSEHYLTNANPQMIMKTDILDYKNCTCIMISKKVQTFIFNPLLLFSRFRFAHKAMRKKKKKKKKKS